MATRYVALLRGINVGKGNRIAMADLRALVEGIGFTAVQTLLNSGNVVFTAPARLKGDHGARIETAIAGALGLKLRVIALDGAELDEILQANPFESVATELGKYLVTILSTQALATKLATIASADWSPERIAVVGRAAYHWCPDGSIDSKLFIASSKALGDGATTRNFATLLKLQAMV